MKRMPSEKVYKLLQTLYKNILYRDDPEIMSKVYFDKDGLKKILDLNTLRK